MYIYAVIIIHNGRFRFLPSISSLSLCYISGNGNVYTWGRGTEGQFGHGEKIRFLAHARRVPCKSLQCEVVHISCGELYSSAVTGR